MVGVAATSGYKKPEQHTISVKNSLNNIEVETDEEHTRIHDKTDEPVVKTNHEKRNIKLTHPVIILCFFIYLALIYNIICMLLYKNFGVPSCEGNPSVVYYFGFNQNKPCHPKIVEDRKIETDSLIDINNNDENTIENIRYEDTETSIFDTYINQQEYDYEIEHLKEEDISSETEMALTDAHVSGKYKFF